MKKSRFATEQIIGFIKQADAGMAVAELGRQHGFSPASFYAWRDKYGGMEAEDAKRLKESEAENNRLKRFLGIRQTWTTSMLNNMYACRVCGYISEDPPWGMDGLTPLYDYCVCCGVEHGYQDATVAGARLYRKKWIASGANWHDPSARSHDWCLQHQLENVPDDFA